MGFEGKPANSSSFGNNKKFRLPPNAKEDGTVDKTMKSL